MELYAIFVPWARMRYVDEKTHSAIERWLAVHIVTAATIGLSVEAWHPPSCKPTAHAVAEGQPREDKAVIGKTFSAFEGHLMSRYNLVAGARNHLNLRLLSAYRRALDQLATEGRSGLFRAAA